MSWREHIWLESFYVSAKKRDMQMAWPEPVVRSGKMSSDRLDINIWKDREEIALHTALL